MNMRLNLGSQSLAVPLMLLCVLMWVLWGGASARAAIVPPVTGVSSAGGIVLSEGARGSLVWTVNFSAVAGPATSTISSNQVVFRTLSGTVIGTQSRRLSGVAVGTGSLSLAESLNISSAIAYRAYQLGSAGVVVERAFTDSGNPTVPVTGTVVLPITTAPSSGLSVSRVDLQFNNASRVTQVGQGEELRARATLRLSGNGWLDARWEIADGSGREGEALFRPLRAVRQYVGGTLPVELESPPLPTAGTGRTLVRLLIREPQGSAQSEPLLYQVLGPSLLPKLELLEPVTDALLSTQTRFEWSEVPGAEAYLIELLPDPSTPGAGAPAERDAAALVRAPGTSLGMSGLMRDKLLPGNTYQWRVLALDAEGRVMAQSGLRRLQAP
jgi:hypothetical protein